MDIMVSDRRLAELLHSELRLIALQNAGVDSWAKLRAGTLTELPEYAE
jgi:hypothetical protein